MRNGTTTQFTRGRADEVAVYGSALDAAAVRAHFEAGRDTTDTTAPAQPQGLRATARLGRVELDWSDVADADLDGYDVFRAASAAGPFTRVNASRLSTSAFTDSSVAGGTAYVYAVTASDVANHRSAHSGQASATPPSTEDLLRRYSPQLRYESQETYFADSAAEMTDNFVAGSRQNFLVAGGGTRIAAANPADPLPNLSLAFLGDPAYANGRAATTSDFLDAANGSYQQDAQRMRAAGYGDRVYGRVITTGGKTWLQYWLFSYYNPQNVLGFGLHEGDWEFAQVGLDADGMPDVATYAQHGGGERCAWSQVAEDAGRRPDRLRRARVACVLLRAGREPARLLPRRLPPRRRLPGRAGARDRHRDDAVHGLARQVGRVVVEPGRAAAAGQVGRSELVQRQRRRLHGGRHAAVRDGTGEGAGRRGARAGDRRRREQETAPRSATGSRRSRTTPRAAREPCSWTWRRQATPRSPPRGACACAAATARSRSGSRRPAAVPYTVGASAFSERGARSGIVRAPLR